MFLVFTVIVHNVEFIEVVWMASWFDVELGSFCELTLFSFDIVKVVDGPIECLFTDFTTDGERSLSEVVTCMIGLLLNTS